MSDLLKTIKIMIILLVFTVLSAYVVGGIFSQPSGNVALIAIRGEIVPDPDFFVEVASSDAIIEQIKDAKINPDVKAILIELNSPGGTVA